MDGWKGFRDDRRAILRLSGKDARAFLQGLITNDMDRVGPDSPLYAAMLTPQGKYLFDFHIFDAAPMGIADAFLLDVAADRAEDLAKRLSMYRLRRDVAIAGASGDFGIALAWDGLFQKTGTCGAKTIILPDSRHPALGVRIIAADPESALNSLGAAPSTAADYDALRVALGAPESGAELIPDESYILENRFEALHGVDFKKGCYVGQEVTARMKHKTALRKGLVRVSVAGDAPSTGTGITADGKPAGTLFTTAGGEGLAHVRLDRARNCTLRAGVATLSIID